MISELQNQLTQKEIVKGLLVYLNRKLWYIFILLPMIAFAFSYIGKHSFLEALFGAFIIALLAEIVLVLMHMRQFSTNKVAIYKLHDDFLEIVGSDGIPHSYPYVQVKSIEARDIIILFLSRNSFAIVSKRHLNAEQICTLRR